jgi:5-methylcytosine-specific restriction endonuclease McrA
VKTRTKWIHPNQMVSLDIRRMLRAGIPHKQALAVALERKTILAGTPTVKAESAEFLDSYEWRRVRMAALKLYGPVCQCCGASKAQGAVIHVDHIKPRKLFPQLALNVNNLQILCHECNHGKGNWDMTDWRTKPVDTQR